MGSAADRYVWSIRSVYRYIMIDIRYIIWYFICDYVTNWIYASQVYLF